jgi:hypothetical protein
MRPSGRYPDPEDTSPSWRWSTLGGWGLTGSRLRWSGKLFPIATAWDRRNVIPRPTKG